MSIAHCRLLTAWVELHLPGLWPKLGTSLFFLTSPRPHDLLTHAGPPEGHQAAGSPVWAALLHDGQLVWSEGGVGLLLLEVLRLRPELMFPAGCLYHPKRCTGASFALAQQQQTRPVSDIGARCQSLLLLIGTSKATTPSWPRAQSTEPADCLLHNVKNACLFHYMKKPFRFNQAVLSC